jgi:hypothetical protein
MGNAILGMIKSYSELSPETTSNGNQRSFGVQCNEITAVKHAKCRGLTMNY